MYAERALRIAGPSAVLVARPGSHVMHVYAGPLTPSGRFVPRSGRTACRAHTSRLSVLNPSAASSLAPTGRRMCARCSARLAGPVPSTGALTPSKGRAEQQHLSREQLRARYVDVTPADLVRWLTAAATEDDVDEAAHVSLLLFGPAGCQTTTAAAPDGQVLTLHGAVHAHRRRVQGHPDPFPNLVISSAEYLERRRAIRAEHRQERDERIRRLGFTNATATKR